MKLEIYNDSDKYVEFGKNSVFNQLSALNSFVEQLLGHLSEDTLTHRISQDSFKMVVGKLDEICQALAANENVSLTDLQKVSHTTVQSFLQLLELATKKGKTVKSLFQSFRTCQQFYESIVARNPFIALTAY